MKATITTLVLVTLMITTAFAGNDKEPGKAKSPVATSFSADISNIRLDTLFFTIMNPEKDKVVVKVYSDRDVQVMKYNIGRKQAVRLTYLMEGMRCCKYKAVIERNNEVVASKEVVLN